MSTQIQNLEIQLRNSQAMNETLRQLNVEKQDKIDELEADLRSRASEADILRTNARAQGRTSGNQ